MDAKQLQAMLASVELFEGMSRRALGSVVSAGRTTNHEGGREVIIEGSGAVGFHLITAGKAKVVRNGRTRRTLGVGDHFGEISVIDGKPRSATIVADGPLETFMIRPSAMRKLLSDQPKFALQLLQVLCARLRDAERS